jgi:hypothetical protein
VRAFAFLNGVAMGHRCQETDPCERERTVRKVRKDGRKSMRRARGLDPPVCRVFRQVQYLRAIREERRAANTQIESPHVELSERRDEVRGCQALACRKRRRPGKEFGICESANERKSRHVPV